jgi:hypothetical protein
LSERAGSAWGKEEGGALHDPSKEACAKLLAAGRSQRAISGELGIHYKTVALWAHHDLMRLRLSELRSEGTPGETFVPVSTTWVAERRKDAIKTALDKAKAAEGKDAAACVTAALEGLADIEKSLERAQAAAGGAKNTPAPRALAPGNDAKLRETLQERLGAQPEPIRATVTARSE